MVEKKGPLKRDDLIRSRKLLSRKANGSLPLEELASMDHVHNILEKTGLANRTALARTFRASAKLPSDDDDVNPSLDRN